MASATLLRVVDARDGLTRSRLRGERGGGGRRAAALLLARALTACTGVAGEAPEADGEARSGGEAPAVDSGSGGGASMDAGSAGGGAPASWAPVETDWCSEGWVGLDEHTCFHVPPAAGTDAPILYVLHGVMAPDTLPVALQAIAAEAADALGLVAVFPRGKQGLCRWDPSVARSFCWPTRRETVDAEAPALLEAWMRAEALLEQVLGARFARRYVMGFSNGGYFASYIGLERLIDVDGAGLVGAGRSVIEAELFSDVRPPIYIAVGALELPSVIASAENLADVLTQHGWAHELAVHPGRRHEIRADDLIAARETWRDP